MATPCSPDTTALATLSSLEHRLQRLTFYLTGDTSQIPRPPNAPTRDITAQARLTALESQLATLSSQKPAVRDLLNLQSTYPDLFHPSSTSPDPPTSLSPGELSAIILSNASAFPTTASQLSSLRDSSIPPADASAGLIALGERLERAEAEQEGIEREAGRLRERSARLVQRWYEGGVLGMGDAWGEWEGRVARVEKVVRREELRRERERQEVDAYQGTT